MTAQKFDVRRSLAEWLRRLAYRRQRAAVARRDARRQGTRGIVTAKEAARIRKWDRHVRDAERTVQVRRAQTQPVGARALAVARTLLDVRETAGNNWGGMVTKIIQANGGVGPEPWCGDFVAYIFRLAGSKAVARGWAWVPGLQRIAGLKKHSTSRVAKPGWLAVFNWDGGLEDHVAVVENDLWTTVDTIEGNTRPGTQSSDAGGGEGVHRRSRGRGEIAYFLEVKR